MTKSVIKYIKDGFVTNLESSPYYLIIKWYSTPTLLYRETINGFYKYAKQ